MSLSMVPASVNSDASWDSADYVCNIRDTPVTPCHNDHSSTWQTDSSQLADKLSLVWHVLPTAVGVGGIVKPPPSTQHNKYVKVEAHV